MIIVIEETYEYLYCGWGLSATLDKTYTTLYPMLSHKQIRREITFKLIGPNSQWGYEAGRDEMKEELIGIFESYRGTKWGKAAETIGDKVIEVVDRESSKADARIGKLEKELKNARQLLLNTVNPFASKMTAQDLHTEILKFLQESE